MVEEEFSRIGQRSVHLKDTVQDVSTCTEENGTNMCCTCHEEKYLRRMEAIIEQLQTRTTLFAIACPSVVCVCAHVCVGACVCTCVCAHAFVRVCARGVDALCVSVSLCVHATEDWHVLCRAALSSTH